MVYLEVIPPSQNHHPTEADYRTEWQRILLDYHNEVLIEATRIGTYGFPGFLVNAGSLYRGTEHSHFKGSCAWWQQVLTLTEP